MDPILIFLHIAKTGGTSLGAILARQFPFECQLSAHWGETRSALGVWSNDAFDQAWQALDNQRRKAIRHVAGHSMFGVHRIIDRPCTYVGMIRDPIDRVASSYYYIATQPGIPVSRHIANGMTLREYIDSGLGLDPHNYQTRILSGEERHNAQWDEVRAALDRGMDDAALAAAIGNAGTHFSVIGPTERFDQVLMLMKLEYGFPVSSLLYEKKNVNPERPAVDQLDGETIAAIRQANVLDIALHKWVCEQFEARCRRLGPGFVDACQCFDELLTEFREHGLSDRIAARCSDLDARCDRMTINGGWA